MGKTPTPLVIWVDPHWAEHEKIVALKAQGHIIAAMEDVNADYGQMLPDLILSESAWYWTDASWPHLEAALKAARARKKGAKRAEG